MAYASEIPVLNDVPFELKSIEFDAEKKSFKVNGRELGNAISGFSITCKLVTSNLGHCSVTMEYGRRWRSE